MSAPAHSPAARAIPTTRAPGKHEVFAHLARAAEEAGLGLCLWRDRATFPRLSGFDADVLVPPRSWAEIEQFLRDTLGPLGWDLRVAVRRGHLVTCLLARRDAEPGDDEGFLQLDAHAALTAGGWPLASAAALRGRSRVEQGVRWLDATDAAVVGWLEPLLSHGDPKPGYREGVRTALDRDWNRVHALVAEAVGRPLAARLLADVSAPPPVAQLRRALRRQAVRRRWRETVRVLAWKAWDAVAAYLRPSGRLWTVSGPDGAGKTALLAALTPLVARRILVDVERFHTRPYLVPRLGRVVPMRAERRRALLHERGYEAQLGAAKSLVRLVLLLVDYGLGYWLRVRPRLARGRLVVFDRYVQDYLVDPRIRGLDLPLRLLAACARLVPRGARHVYVLARPETLRGRKPELSPEEALAQARRYRALAAADPRAVAVESDEVSAAVAARRLAGRLLAEVSG
jgi:thymidylate kinase